MRTRTTIRALVAFCIVLAIVVAAVPKTRRAVAKRIGAVASTSTEAAATPAEPSATTGAGEARADSSTTSLAPLPVAGVRVERAPFVLTVRGTGRAEAARRVALASRVGERVATVHVREGDRVEAGAPLVELDRRPFEIALREAEARLSTTQLDQQALLYADTTASSDRRARVADRTGVTEAEQRVARARLDLESTVLRAPFAGEIAAVTCEPEERVQSDRPLVTLVDRNRVRIPIEVLESSFGMLRPGAHATLRFPALPGESIPGVVQALGPELTSDRGTGIAWVEVENRAGRIRPGMYAEADLAAQRFEDRIAVPRAAVLERGRRLLVFLARSGRAEWSYVETGLETEDAIEITSGVAAGDTVLVEGHLTLAHGAPVRVSLLDAQRKSPTARNGTPAAGLP